MLWLPGDPVDEDLVAAGCRQGVLLQGLVLLEGGDAGVAEAVRGARILTTRLGIKYDVDVVFDGRSGVGL